MPDSVTIAGTKRISELNSISKLTGQEEVLIDNGDETYRVTVDTLLGYIANQINAGIFPPSMSESTSIVIIPEGEDIPTSERVEGNYYLKVTSISQATVVGAIASRIRVSPNMGLKIVNN